MLSGRALLALAPLVKAVLVEPDSIAIDTKSVVTDTGRGGASHSGYAKTSKNLFADRFAGHSRGPEVQRTLSDLAGRTASVAFTPHLVPMMRGILATCSARPCGSVDTAQLYSAAGCAYANEPLVKSHATEKGGGPHTKWAGSSNLTSFSCAVNPDAGLVVAVAASDNLGKDVPEQAMQNANLTTGREKTARLTGLPLCP